MNVIYGRCSQWYDGKVAIRSQINSCKKEAEKHNQIILEEHLFLDYGKSGRNLNRQQMILLLDWITSGKMDNGHLFVASYDRLSRDLGDLTYLLELFEAHDIHVHSAKEKIPDDMLPSARTFYIHSLGVISQNYLETCRNHAFVTIERRRKEGKPLGAAPYGYKHTGDTFILISEEAETIQLIFSLYLSGLGYKKICKELNQRSQYIYGRPFKDTDIYRILVNQTYAGIFGKGDQSYQGNHQAIITIAEYEQVQKLRKSKIQEKKHFVEYPLKNKLRCSCGWQLSGHMYAPKKGKKRRYYVCSNPIHREKGYPSKLPADRLETEVLARVKKFLTNRSFIHQLVQEVHHQQKARAIVEMKQVESIEKKKQQLFIQYEQSELTAPELKDQLDQLKKKVFIVSRKN
ncbi:recombinase family protein [Enterococcus crotali]|uniref:recombinase family protein n=1 Tax=Enterococcus crotali TaxID=1453587 RepID=UPI00046FE957|nr:recombinase family protein [Enterococcus crotali]